MPRHSVDSIEGNRISFVRGRVSGVEIGTRISAGVAEAIADYLNYVLDTLGLEQWRIFLYDDAPEDDSKSAVMNSRTDTWDMGLWIGTQFFDDRKLPDSWRTQILVHEVLHLHFEHAWNFFTDVCERALGSEAREVAFRAYREDMELGIDKLSARIVTLLPKLFTLPSEKVPVVRPLKRTKNEKS